MMAGSETLGGREYGSFGLRLVGFIIDVILVAVFAGIIGAILGAMVGTAGVTLAGLTGPAYVISMNANGGTLGKRAMGLRLENDRTGQDIGYWPSVGRYIVAIASAIVLLLGYLWVLWDAKNQTWHDKAVRSVVVKVYA